MAGVNNQRHDWRDIFYAFKMAFDPKKMFLGYIGLLASLIWCIVVVSLFSALKFIDVSPGSLIKPVLYSAKEGLPVVFTDAFYSYLSMGAGGFFVLVIVIIGLLAIWSMLGGAITRIAALDYAKDESIRLIDSLKFSRRKFWSYFWSPMVPIVGVFLFAFCNVIAGLAGRIPVLGEIIVAIGFPLALFSGFLMVMIGVIGALGLCFMFPTISAEGSDAFDAMSRAYSYVLSRPKQFFLYCTINVLYGFVCFAVVAFLALLMIRLAFFTVGAGMGDKFHAVQNFIFQKCSIACLGFCSSSFTETRQTNISLHGWSLKFLAGVLITYIFLIKLIVWNFVVTYLFSAKTIIYFLLRKEIDSTVITDVYLEDGDQEGNKEVQPKQEFNSDERSLTIGENREEENSGI